jgi:hypothetical protein
MQHKQERSGMNPPESWAAVDRAELDSVDPDFDDVVEQSEQRRERIRRGEQRQVACR